MKVSRAKRRWISEKIRYLVDVEGYPQRQAIAIAHRMAGVPKPSTSSQPERRKKTSSRRRR